MKADVRMIGNKMLLPSMLVCLGYGIGCCPKPEPITWEKVFGGSSLDRAYAIDQTADGEFVLAGTVGTDVYVAKLDGRGARAWERYYGDSANDAAYAIEQATDGGYIVAGYVHPPDATSDLDDDIYILKLDEEGEL